MSKRIVLMLVLVLGWGISSTAQSEPATMYFKDGDSIDGLAVIRNNKIKFKLDENDKADFWNHETVSRIVFNRFGYRKRTYEYVQLRKGGRLKLAEVLTFGEVVLYCFEDNLVFSILSRNPNELIDNNNPYKRVQHYYLYRKSTKEMLCLDCNLLRSWRKQVIAFLSDCPELVNSLKHNEYSYEQMQDIVDYYNDFCSDL